MSGLAGGSDEEPRNLRLVRWVRLFALLGGMTALVLAMVVFQEPSRARDWAWSVGIALLILSLVANRLIPKSG